MECPKCHASVPDSARHCTKCGEKLVKDDEDKAEVVLDEADKDNADKKTDRKTRKELKKEEKEKKLSEKKEKKNPKKKRFGASEFRDTADDEDVKEKGSEDSDSSDIEEVEMSLFEKPEYKFFSPEAKDKKKKTAKTIVVLLCAVVIVVGVLYLALSHINREGERCAEKASEYIGNGIERINSEEDMHFADESGYFGVNNALHFDYIYESEKNLSSGGIKYPQWAVLLKMSKQNFITDVTYVDFTAVKKDTRGLKRDTLINLDSVTKGEKLSAVESLVGIRPYSINYSQKGVITYTYKYYFKRDNGDEQAVVLRIGFDEKDKQYLYHTSELVVPDMD